MKITKITVVLFIVCMFLSFSSMGAVVADAETNDTAFLYVPGAFNDSNYRKWRGIENLLINSNYKVYVLYWQGYGGYTYMGKEFIAAVEKAKAQGKIVIFKLTGGSYSMHATAVCYASKIDNSFNKFLMFHADSFKKDNKDYRVRRDNSDVEQQLKHCVDVGILTNEELNKMWSGYEVYKDKNDVWYREDPRPLE